MSGEWSLVTRDDKKRVMRRRRRAGSRTTTRSRHLHGRPQSGHHHAASGETIRPVNSPPDRRATYEMLLSRCQQELEHLSVTRLVADSAPFKERIAGGKNKNKCRLVCYGIGNFSETSASYYSASMCQLALALSLREAWEIDESYFLDPCVNSIEQSMLQEHGFRVLENKQGRQAFLDGVDDDGRIVVFFMPHCPRRLYENVVCAHHDCLDQVLILGNSLRNYVDSLAAVSSASNSSNERASASCLETLYPYIREYPLTLGKRLLNDANGNLEGALNDTYWTTFASTRGVPSVDLQHVTTDDKELL